MIGAPHPTAAVTHVASPCRSGRDSPAIRAAHRTVCLDRVAAATPGKRPMDVGPRTAEERLGGGRAGRAGSTPASVASANAGTRVFAKLDISSRNQRCNKSRHSEHPPADQRVSVRRCRCPPAAAAPTRLVRDDAISWGYLRQSVRGSARPAHAAMPHRTACCPWRQPGRFDRR
jgi:hypothetical protein